jgi:hypothetical protein
MDAPAFSCAPIPLERNQLWKKIEVDDQASSVYLVIRAWSRVVRVLSERPETGLLPGAAEKSCKRAP